MTSKLYKFTGNSRALSGAAVRRVREIEVVRESVRTEAEFQAVIQWGYSCLFGWLACTNNNAKMKN